MDRRSITRVSVHYDAFAAASAQAPLTAKLHFTGVDGRDVYNITAPFHSAGRRVIAGRVERRDSEDSTAIFFEECGEVWHPIDGAPHLKLQDPFVTQVAGEIVFGGVEISHEQIGLIWRTVFYRGQNIFELRRFFAGPMGMKDIRLCELSDGRVGIFTRPRGLWGERGMIGYTEVPTLDDLTVEAIEGAPMIGDMFHPHDWGGANETHLLENGEIGIVAHAAYFEEDDSTGHRRYHAIAFTFDPATRRWRDYRIIAARNLFSPGAAKRPDLADVVFSSGIECIGPVTRLYAGTSDAEAHWLEIPYPFSQPRSAGNWTPHDRADREVDRKVRA